MTTETPDCGKCYGCIAFGDCDLKASFPALTISSDEMARAAAMAEATPAATPIIQTPARQLTDCREGAGRKRPGGARPVRPADRLTTPTFRGRVTPHTLADNLQDRRSPRPI